MERLSLQALLNATKLREGIEEVLISNNEFRISNTEVYFIIQHSLFGVRYFLLSLLQTFQRSKIPVKNIHIKAAAANAGDGQVF